MGEQTGYVLHEWRISPFCNKARQLLAHKGVPFTTVRYNGLLATRARGLSHAGKLPVLELGGGERVQDSAEIARVLEERHPDPPLLPVDPCDRARARTWESWAGEALYFYEVHYRFGEPEARALALDALCEGRPRWERAALALALPRMYRRKLHEQGIGRLEPAEIDRRLQAHLDDLEVLVADGAWLAGASRSIADIAVAAQLEEMIRTSRPGPWITGRPAVAAWLARVDPAGMAELGATGAPP
jgi:glutathione S-transferase